MRRGFLADRLHSCASAAGGVPASWAYMGLLDSASRTRLHSSTISSWPSYHRVLAAVCTAVGAPLLVSLMYLVWTRNPWGIREKVGAVFVVPP